ncbi:MAG: hypothetical protein PHS65_07640, partial [Arcobacteraceae bacterium]|nr:hypothetical protein [Arcobacteraceae bacterium]
SPVYQDESFLNSYQNVDGNFNEIAFANQHFLEQYDFELKVNDQTFPLTYEDIFYSQRVIEAKSEHKNALNVQNNHIVVVIKNKSNQQIIDNAKISMRVMTPTNNSNDLDLENFQFSNNVYETQFSLPNKGNFNITGVITIDDKKGYIFLKTNAI